MVHGSRSMGLVLSCFPFSCSFGKNLSGASFSFPRCLARDLNLPLAGCSIHSGICVIGITPVILRTTAVISALPQPSDWGLPGRSGSACLRRFWKNSIKKYQYPCGIPFPHCWYWYSYATVLPRLFFQILEPELHFKLFSQKNNLHYNSKQIILRFKLYIPGKFCYVLSCMFQANHTTFHFLPHQNVPSTYPINRKCSQFLIWRHRQNHAVS